VTRLARFESALLPHLDAAYNLARWITRDDQDAQDVVQEAMLRAFRYFDSLREAQARPWLLAIVRNTGYTWLEKNRPADLLPFEEGTEVTEIDGWTPAESNPEVIMLASAQRKLIAQALEEMPVAYREVLVLRELEDLSYKDVARIAGVPIGTVMSRLARGRELLRRTLEIRMKKAS
jgi:RNA polymerase sigma-70 factor (ECF subfamily)